tara:strand:- start:1969 stop:2622 length:654 start_codon:yes stop_codon:yes gene_type:complete
LFFGWSFSFVFFVFLLRFSARKTIDFSVVVVQTGRAQKCGGGGGGGPPVAREKKRRRKSRRVHSLAREVAELFRARPSRPEWFFRFPEGRLGRKTEDKFCASAGFIFFLSRLLKEPAWSYKRGGKTRVDIRKRKRIDDEDSRNPLFFFWNQNKQQTVIATTALVAASIVSPEASHAAQNVVAQVAEGEPFLVDVAWGAILSSFSFSLALVVWGRSGL